MPNEPQKEPPAEIKAVIETALGAFNDKNFSLFNSTFGGEVVIVDGFAPYRWLGPDAQGRWWADAETWAKDLGVLGAHIGSRDPTLAGGRDSRIRCSFRDSYDHSTKGRANHSPGNPHLHILKAGRRMEGRGTYVGSFELNRWAE